MLGYSRGGRVGGFPGHERAAPEALRVSAERPTCAESPPGEEELTGAGEITGACEIAGAGEN